MSGLESLRGRCQMIEEMPYNRALQDPYPSHTAAFWSTTLTILDTFQDDLVPSIARDLADEKIGLAYIGKVADGEVAEPGSLHTTTQPFLEAVTHPALLERAQDRCHIQRIYSHIYGRRGSRIKKLVTDLMTCVDSLDIENMLPSARWRFLELAIRLLIETCKRFPEAAQDGLAVALSGIESRILGFAAFPYYPRAVEQLAILRGQVSPLNRMERCYPV